MTNFMSICPIQFKYVEADVEVSFISQNGPIGMFEYFGNFDENIEIKLFEL